MDDPLDIGKTVMPDSGTGRGILAPGSLLGQYRIVRLLGRGGMGEVYLVEHSRLGTRHALKIILPQFAASAGFRDRFLIEARIMAKLNHPHIVHCADAGEDQGISFMVMEYIEGPHGEPLNLRQFMDERRHKGEVLEEEEAVAVGIGVCEGLSYAHAFRDADVVNGVVHRDLKPANILIDRDTKLYITDFGLARLIGADFEKSVIEQSMVALSMGGERTQGHASATSSETVGTFDYMSPEQREGRPADRRSDVYAMGAILYELLTGRKVSGVPSRPSKVREGLSNVWDEIVYERCLAYEPGERFENAQQLIAALKSIAAKSSGLESDEETADGASTAFAGPVADGRPRELLDRHKQSRTSQARRRKHSALTWLLTAATTLAVLLGAGVVSRQYFQPHRGTDVVRKQVDDEAERYSIVEVQAEQDQIERKTVKKAEMSQPVLVENLVLANPDEGVVTFDDVGSLLVKARQMETNNELVQARDTYRKAMKQRVEPRIRREIEQRIGEINVNLVESSRSMSEKTDYVVQSGDSLHSIARRFGSTVELVERSNNIMNPNGIMVGDLLRIFNGKFSIEISKTRNELLLLCDGEFFKRYRVATGKYERTPSGTFEIREKTVEPTWWRPDGKSFAFGEKENILGTRWIQILPTGDTPPARGYGIHGTWDGSSIGKSVSAGCIRMHNKEVEELYDLVPEGTPVTISE